MYAYITQGRPDRGLLRLTPRAQAIITQGIGVYAAPLLQPTQITARTAQGNPIYVYHPTAIARLPIPSDTDIIYFTDASGTQQRTPTVGCASVRITRHADGLHVEHHTVKVLPWVVVGAGGLGAGKTSGAGTRGVFLDVVIGGRTRDTDTNGGESSDNRSKVHADCGPAENPSL